jgi:predicted O-methyltransferase YrrM
VSAPDPAGSLDRLLAGPPALEPDDWSLGRTELEFVVDEIAAGRREIAECGSGLSTIVIGRALRELGDGHVHSLEQDPTWAQLVRMRLASEGLAGIATVIEAPLEAHPLAPPGARWYASWALAELPEAGIDLLLVDGPIAGDTGPERGRYPALPALAGRLAPGATVILDDAGRPGETWVVERWEAEHGLAFERRGELAVARR